MKPYKFSWGGCKGGGFFEPPLRFLFGTPFLFAKRNGVKKNPFLPKRRAWIAPHPSYKTYETYFSTISSTSMGQALTQMPQAMHLEATGLSGTFTQTWKGQTSAHLPQPMQSFLLIM